MWEIRLKKAIRAVNPHNSKSLQPYRIKELVRTLRGIGLHNNSEILKKAGISLNSLLVNVKQSSRKVETKNHPVETPEGVQILIRGPQKTEKTNLEPKIRGNILERWSVKGIEGKAIVTSGLQLQGWEETSDKKRVSKSRVLDRLFNVLTEERKKEQIDDTLRQKVIQNIQRQIKLNTWIGNRHKKSLPLKGRTVNKYNSRKRWRP